MNYRVKILLDRAVGIPIAVLLDQLLLLERKLPHRVRINPEPKVILLTKIVGMGSAIQATPAINALRAAHPNAEINFLTGKANEAMLKRFSAIDNVFTIEDGSPIKLVTSTLKTILKIRKKKPDVVIDLEVYSSLSSLLNATFGARRRIGFYRKSCAYKEGIFTDLVFFNTKVPVWKLYHQIVRVIGAEKIGVPKLGPIKITEKENASALEKIKNSQYLVVNTNASDLLLERRWPQDRFVELIKQLNGAGHHIVLTGSPAEAPYVEETFQKLNPDMVQNLAGKLSLGEFLATIGGAQALITNDTGPMHISAALNVPTVALFGPGDPAHYTIPSPTMVTISHPVTCGPCLYHADLPPCRGKNICMQKISVNQVFEATQALLRGDAIVSGNPEMENSYPDGEILGHRKLV